MFKRKMNDVQSIARSPRFSRDAQRGRALAAARAILAGEGLRALGARRVAGAIGVSVGTLYNLFESFDDLILNLNLETLAELANVFASLPPLPADPEAATLTIARAYLDFTGAHRCRWAAVLEFKTPTPHAHMDDFRATIDRLVATVERALAPLFPRGAEPDRRLSAAVLWTSLEGISALTAADTIRLVAATTAWDMAQALVVNYVRGLRAGMRLRGT
jgi:AcrR family transcriptional regulator